MIAFRAASIPSTWAISLMLFVRVRVVSTPATSKTSFRLEPSV